MPDCLSLERLADKFGPVLESGNLDFERVLIHLSNKSGSLYLNCLRNSTAYAEHLLSFCKSGILLHARQRLPMGSDPIKNLGH